MKITVQPSEASQIMELEGSSTMMSQIVIDVAASPKYDIFCNGIIAITFQETQDPEYSTMEVVRNSEDIDAPGDRNTRYTISKDSYNEIVTAAKENHMDESAPVFNLIRACLKKDCLLAERKNYGSLSIRMPLGQNSEEAERRIEMVRNALMMFTQGLQETGMVSTRLTSTLVMPAGGGAAAPDGGGGNADATPPPTSPASPK